MSEAGTHPLPCCALAAAGGKHQPDQMYGKQSTGRGAAAFAADPQRMPQAAKLEAVRGASEADLSTAHSGTATLYKGKHQKAVANATVQQVPVRWELALLDLAASLAAAHRSEEKISAAAEVRAKRWGAPGAWRERATCRCVSLPKRAMHARAPTCDPGSLLVILGLASTRCKWRDQVATLLLTR